MAANPNNLPRAVTAVDNHKADWIGTKTHDPLLSDATLHRRPIRWDLERTDE